MLYPLLRFATSGLTVSVATPAYTHTHTHTHAHTHSVTTWPAAGYFHIVINIVN